VQIAIVTYSFRKKIVAFFDMNKVPKLNQFFEIIITFILSCFAWIFFRANNIKGAFIIIKKISTFKGPIFFDQLSIIVYPLFGIFLLLFVELKQEYYGGSFSFLNNKNWIFRYLSYSFLIILILLIGVFDGGQFIYFQF
jgi:alginate O-acetyltransferase complex protein AlgI